MSQITPKFYREHINGLMKTDRLPIANTDFAAGGVTCKLGVLCNYDSAVLNSNFVHLIKFSAANQHIRQAQK